MRLPRQQLAALMRGEVGDQQPAAGREHAGGLGQHRCWVLGIVQHHLQRDGVEGGIGDRQPVHIRLPHRAVLCQPALGQPGAGQGQHGAGGIDAQGGVGGRPGPPGGQLQQATGAGADIQQAPGACRQGLQQRRLDGGGGQAQGTHLVPVRALALEGLGGLARPLRRQPRRGAPVGGELRVFLRQPRRDHVGEAGLGGDLEIDVGPFRHPVQQPGLGQQPKMARQAGLGLAEQGAEIGHAPGPPGAEGQEAEARRLGGGTKLGEKFFHSWTMT